MTNAEIRRDCTGKLHLFVNGVPAMGVSAINITTIDDKLSAVVIIPMSALTIGEVNTVVPMRKAA